MYVVFISGLMTLVQEVAIPNRLSSEQHVGRKRDLLITARPSYTDFHFLQQEAEAPGADTNQARSAG
jgi:hypothetical protein